MSFDQRYQRLELDDSSPAGNVTPNTKGRIGTLSAWIIVVLLAMGSWTALTIGMLSYVLHGGAFTNSIADLARHLDWAQSGGEKLGSMARLRNSDEYPTDVTRDITPVRVHSHNDYWRAVPLFDALHTGCIGIEADVWSRNNDLLVGHSRASLTEARTFSRMYVKPLVDLLDRQNPRTDFYFAESSRRHGVYDTDAEQTLVLLVDFKTHGRELFPIVEQQLEPLRARQYLSYYNGSQVVPGPITVVGTGNVPFEKIHETEQRDIFFDAPLDKLEDGFVIRDDETTSKGKDAKAKPADSALEVVQFGPENSYYASTNFRQTIGTVLSGRLTDEQLAKVREQIKAAADRGLKSRYWGTPTWPISTRNYVWRTLMDEGAEILNADDLPAAARMVW